MKNIRLSFGLSLSFFILLLIGCSSTSFETTEDVKVYEAELKTWAESIKELPDEAYTKEVVTKICECVNRIDFEKHQKLDRKNASDSIKLRINNHIAFIGMKLYLYDTADGSLHEELLLQKLEEGVMVRCKHEYTMAMELVSNMFE